MKEIARCAEAVIYQDGEKIVKDRIVKSYRISELDEKLRGFRNRRESKVLQKLGEIGFKSPKLLGVETGKGKEVIEMEFLDGKQVRDVIDKDNCVKLGNDIGKKIKIIHDSGIIHGDLTTSNMIFLDEVYFIDFGLSFFSPKIEDKAVDLHLLKQTLESKHHSISEECFNSVLEGYGDKEVIEWLHSDVEKRGRHKRKH